MSSLPELHEVAIIITINFDARDQENPKLEKYFVSYTLMHYYRESNYIKITSLFSTITYT